MKCPFCGSLDDKVIESRQNNSGSTIRRRRECLSCSYRFTSYERIEEVPLKVIKRDGHRQDFDLKKIENGLWRSLEKRPVTQMDVENLLHELEDEVHLRGKSNNEIKSSEIGALILEKLYTIDHVGYIRFASVYRKFEDVNEFIKEIENISRNFKK
ncbi:transcriptional regulator NrdR [Spirochaeta isovalerica]|uniref:Transcriptional repressor NrdR n=1 Tax=Spirochaeta isovalerica TaxID=150 RepID=A0A841RBV5_9SPIO|nr:transcriptional regulator NrdR [Spirochaeta isovalerica]MBB6480379.1 transcriptional repressor NrdR [Spirochaeta isovalerica]